MTARKTPDQNSHDVAVATALAAANAAAATALAAETAATSAATAATAAAAAIALAESRSHALEISLTKQLTALNLQVEHLIRIAQTYVTKETFRIVQVIVYGMAGIILTSALTAILARIFSK